MEATLLIRRLSFDAKALSRQEQMALGEQMLQGQRAHHFLEQGGYSPEEEARLRRQIRRGEKAKETLVLAHLRLVLGIVSRLYPADLPEGVDYWDLFQETSLALLETLERYDPEQGGFTPFVRRRLEGAARNILRQAVGDAETEETEGSSRRPEAQRPIPLESLSWEDGNPWDELLSPEGDFSPAEIAERQEENRSTRQVVSWLLRTRLTDLQQYVLIHSFGLFGHPQLTEEEIAQMWPEGKCTFQNVSEVKTTALERLRGNTPAIARLLAEAALGEVELFDFEQLRLGI